MGKKEAKSANVLPSMKINFSRHDFTCMLQAFCVGTLEEDTYTFTLLVTQSLDSTLCLARQQVPNLFIE